MREQRGASIIVRFCNETPTGKRALAGENVFGRSLTCRRAPAQTSGLRAGARREFRISGFDRDDDDR